MKLHTTSSEPDRIVATSAATSGSAQETILAPAERLTEFRRAHLRVTSARARTEVDAWLDGSPRAVGDDVAELAAERLRD